MSPLLTPLILTDHLELSRGACPDPNAYKQMPLHHPTHEEWILRKKSSKYPVGNTSLGIRQAGAQIPVSHLLALRTWAGSIMMPSLFPDLRSKMHATSSRALGLRRTI